MTTTPESKPGYLTSEFALTVAAWVVAIVLAIGSALVEREVFGEGSVQLRITLAFMDVAAFGAAALASLGYSVNRGIVKAEAIKANALVEKAAIEMETADSLAKVARDQVLVAQFPNDPPVRREA